MIRLLFLIPQTGLESIAKGVISKEPLIIAKERPGASLSMTLLVASGVISRGEKPVPPVVRIKLKCNSSAQMTSFAEISFNSSGTHSLTVTCAFRSEPLLIKVYNFAPLTSSVCP